MYTHPQYDREQAKQRRKEVGQWLRKKRLEIEKTQRDVASEVGFAYYTMISQIETGHTRVPPEAMESYAKALKVEPKDFVKTLMYYYDPVTWQVLFGPNKTK